MIRIDMHELEHLDVFGFAQQIAEQIVVFEIARIADERCLRIREPRVMTRAEVPQMNVRIDHLHGALLAKEANVSGKMKNRRERNGDRCIVRVRFHQFGHVIPPFAHDGQRRQRISRMSVRL